MNVLFSLNIAFSLFLVLGASLLNLAQTDKCSIHYRLSWLGWALSVTMSVYFLWHNNFIALSVPYIALLSLFSWMCIILHVSFIIDLTACRRPRHFYLLYLSPIPLTFFSLLIPRPVGLITFVVCVLCFLFLFSLRILLAWIHSSSDERARRDAQWMLITFIVFAIGIFVSVFNSLTGLFWVLTVWYLLTYVVINHLKIFSHLSNVENQLIMDNVFDIIIVLDRDGRIIRMNRRCCQITGLSDLLIHGRGIESLVVHPDLAASGRGHWLDRFGWYDTGSGSGSGSGRSPSIDASLTTINGEEIPVDLRVICLVDLQKKITGYIVSASDMRITLQLMKEISDREYAARELALSESKFSRMFIFNPTGIMIVNLETLMITDANPAIEEILECESSALSGKTLAEIGLEMEDITLVEFIEKIKMEGTISEFGASFKTESNKKRKCRLSAVSFDLNRTGNILLAVADVTQQETLSEALGRKQQVETIGVLAGGIAHDFNNILVVILGHIGLAKMRTVDKHARAPIEKAEQACLRAREITGQLLAFSRGGKPVIGRCDTRQLIVDAAMVSVNDSSIACLFDIDRDIWPLKADRIQIGQIITNLVSNAVQAMDGRGIIEISARNKNFKNLAPQRRPRGFDAKPLPEGAYVEIRVQDQGPGIPEAIRSKIFDPFFSTKEKGTGLGLSIVYSIIQNHLGSINLETREGDGATFIIVLPADSVIVKPEKSRTNEYLSGKMRVLLMDDDVQVREMASALLESFGYEVMEASDGDEATLRYQEAFEADQRFDVCILDLMVQGGVSGIECAKKILAIDSEALLIVSSGYSDDPVLSHFRDYGFRGIIPKPYTIEELRNVLANILVQ